MVLRHLSRLRHDVRRFRHRRQSVRGRSGALGLQARRQRRAAPRAGAQDLGGARHGTGHAEESRDVLPGKPVSLRGIDADAHRRRMPHARRQLDCARIDDPVSRGEHGVLRFPVLGHAGDVDVDALAQVAARSRLLALRLPPRRRAGPGAAGRHPRLDPGDRAVGDRRSPRELYVSRASDVPQ